MTGYYGAVEFRNNQTIVKADCLKDLPSLRYL